MKKPSIYRKRYIPLETVDISGDELLFRSPELLITRWNALKPRADFAKGVSFTFLEEGFKISRYYDHQGNFIYWYCDIVEVHYDENEDAYTLVDLLLDIKVLADATLQVLDAAELAEALETELISLGQACHALKTMDRLLKLIDAGDFPPAPCRQEQYWEL